MSPIPYNEPTLHDNDSIDIKKIMGQKGYEEYHNIYYERLKNS